MQAQRKFAQGAFVPQSNQLISRRDVTPKEDTSSRIKQNNIVNIHVKNLLDIVSFKNMHTHLQPVVLLERLQRATVQIVPPPVIENNNNTVTQRPKIAHNKPNYSMRLRSRHSRPPIKKKLKDRTRPILKRKASIQENVRVKRRRVVVRNVESSDFSNDDCMPLTYFTSAPNQVEQNTTSQQPATPEAELHPESSSLPNGINTQQHQDESENDISLAYTQEVELLPESSPPQVEVNAQQPQDDDENNIVLIYDDDESPGDEQNTNVVATDGPPYYSANQIKIWMRDMDKPQDQDITVIVDDDSFKVPDTPKQRTEERVEKPIRISTPLELDLRSTIGSERAEAVTVGSVTLPPSPCLTVCPSENYTTARDVISAPRHDLERRCRNCDHCHRVDKVHHVATMVREPRSERSSGAQDIYEFDADNDDAMENPRFRNFRQNRRSSSTQEVVPMPVPNTATSVPLYLDLLPQHSTQIIQIMSDKVNDKIIRARLIPKSQASATNEFSLIEHENLLDQLSSILNPSNAQLSFDSADSSRQQELIVMPNSSSPAASVTSTPSADQGVSFEQGVTVALISTEPRDRGLSKSTPQQTPVASSSADEEVQDAPTSDDEEVQAVLTSVDEVVQALSTSADQEVQAASALPEHRVPVASTSADMGRTSRASTETIPPGSDGPSTRASFPKGVESAKVVDAPVFYPTEAEFSDPVAYFEKIMPTAAKFGLCKVVAPASFKPTCNNNDNIQFTVMNQYIARLYSRWGPAQREMCAIKAYLASQSVVFTRPPLLDRLEVNLPKLYHLVQHNGGLKKVIEKKRWSRVAEEMRHTGCVHPERKLDLIYVKYLLPYDTLSHQERQEMLCKVERCWFKKNRKLLDRAMNPLHRQKKLLCESDSSEDDEEDDENVATALTEAEDCVVLGRSMNLATFKRIASNVMNMHFPEAAAALPTAVDVENKYWRLVLLATDHVCVNSASIDTGNEGIGFTKNKADTYGKHPWNLKMMSQNPGNVLRSLGPVLGVTVPTLHVGMIFSTSCWHRDPHGLPWMEYMHNGPGKIWYGIPDEQSTNFRKAVETLCPTSCQNKSIWLPSDITMIPPNLLQEHNVSLSRVVQEPGEFIIVFPKAYSCSISTGYTQSESVYFATNSWLQSVHQVFQEVRESSEPTMFSVEHLLVSVARDQRASLAALQQVYSNLSPIVRDELQYRHSLLVKGFKVSTAETRVGKQQRRRRAGAWNVREQDECEICRRTLYLSKVVGMTSKRSSVCLQHALQLLKIPKYKNKGVSHLEVVLHFPDSELESMLHNVERRLAVCQ